MSRDIEPSREIDPIAYRQCENEAREKGADEDFNLVFKRARQSCRSVPDEILLTNLELVDDSMTKTISSAREVKRAPDCVKDSFEIFSERRENFKVKENSRASARQSVTPEEIRRALGLWDNTAIPGFR